MNQPERAFRFGRFVTSTILLAMVGGGWLGALYAAGGRVVVEKALLHLAMPAGLLWLCLSLACLQLRDRKLTPLFGMVFLSWFVLTVGGNGHVSGALLRHLESDYYQIRPVEDARAFDVVAVLGGGCSVGANGATQTNSAGERVVLAARMYHAGLVRRIVCTGERIRELNPDGTDPGAQSEEILLQLGVPNAAIERVGGINTASELKALAERFANGERVGLITSASHLGRAMRLAETEGLNAEPLPGGFRSRQSRDTTVSSLLLSVVPRSEAVNNTALAARELLAEFAGR